jgi:predicted GNAT family N-acyltransferase
MISVRQVSSEEELRQAFDIRYEVFVAEQQVPAQEEYDEHEATSRHFLAYLDGQACGTARWRYKGEAIKLERFAVLKAYRSAKVGSALLEAVLQDIASFPQSQGKTRYLHAQVTAVGLYRKFGFVEEGDLFMECDIAHYKMVLR